MFFLVLEEPLGCVFAQGRYRLRDSSQKGLELPLIGISAWGCNTRVSPSDTYSLVGFRRVF